MLVERQAGRVNFELMGDFRFNSTNGPNYDSPFDCDLTTQTGYLRSCELRSDCFNASSSPSPSTAVQDRYTACLLALFKKHNTIAIALIEAVRCSYKHKKHAVYTACFRTGTPPRFKKPNTIAIACRVRNWSAQCSYKQASATRASPKPYIQLTKSRRSQRASMSKPPSRRPPTKNSV